MVRPPAGPPQGRPSPPRGSANTRSDERGGSCSRPRFFRGLERALEVVDQVVGVFQANGQADGAGPDARARAVARATLLGYFGYFFGPPVLGLIAGSFGLRAAFVATAFGIAAVLVLAPMMARAMR